MALEDDLCHLLARERALEKAGDLPTSGHGQRVSSWFRLAGRSLPAAQERLEGVRFPFQLSLLYRLEHGLENGQLPPRLGVREKPCPIAQEGPQKLQPNGRAVHIWPTFVQAVGRSSCCSALERARVSTNSSLSAANTFICKSSSLSVGIEVKSRWASSSRRR
jgi:hypothetical protein